MDIVYPFFIYPIGAGIFVSFVSTIISLVLGAEYSKKNARGSCLDGIAILIAFELMTTFFMFCMSGWLNIAKWYHVPMFLYGIIVAKIVIYKSLIG